jgi:hypothetical protein
LPRANAPALELDLEARPAESTMDTDEENDSK